MFILPLLAAFSIGVLPLCMAEAAKPALPSIPVVGKPLVGQTSDELAITEKDGRWLVSAKALQQYGLREVSGKPGYFPVAVPAAKNGQNLWPDPVTELAFPVTHDLSGIRDVSIRQIRRPLGFTYELLKHDQKQLLPPIAPLNAVPQLEQQELPKVGDKKAKTDTVIVWDYKMRDNDSIPDIKARQPVISPCVFSVTQDGVVLKNQNFDLLVENYQKKGYAVWPLVNNKFNPKMTHEILQDKKLQDRVIKELIGYAVLYGFNGYNIDFENIDFADKDNFSSFVAALADACRAYGLTSSVDVTPHSDNKNWSMVYDRNALGNSVDYVVLMAYDQFTVGGKVAGPVASYPWVDKGIQRLLDEISAPKVILGLNFYMRIWFEAQDARKLPKDPAQWKVLDQPAHYGKPVRLDARTLSMEDSPKIMKMFEKYARWDNNMKLFYMELPLDIGVVKIWFEDEKSLKERLDLMKQYQLSGVAFWRKGFESEKFWDGFGKHEFN